MKVKMTAIAATVVAACAAGFAGPAAAQISGDVVRIGLITDLSGVYIDIDGQGGVEAIKMAIADFGGSVNGKKIELITADHQNKADIAASKAREWFDQQGVDMLIGGTNSGTSLAMAKVAGEKKKTFIAVGGATARLTNEECTPYTIHYAYDTVALAKGTGSAIVKNGGKSWYFLTADYAFGASLEKDTSDIVKANGGTVVGSVKHPLGASDFSSFMLQAQASKAQILGLANAGGDTINSIKAANEFGIKRVVSQHGSPAAEPVIPKMPVKPVTREHLVKLLAIACVIREPDRFNVSLPTLPSEERLVTVSVDNSMPIARAASHAGMSTDALKDINAAFRNGVVDTSASPYLLMPKNKVEQFQSSLLAESQGGSRSIPGTATLPPLGAALSAANGDDDKPAKSSASTRTHTVKAGESLWAIARRYSVDIKQIEQWNHLSGPTVKPGQVLKINAPG